MFSVCIAGELLVPWNKSEHSECNVFWSDRRQCLRDHTAIGAFPVCVQNAGVDAKADSEAMFPAFGSRLYSLIERCGSQFIFFDGRMAVETPGDNGVAAGWD